MLRKELEMSLICTYCQTQLPEDAAFCYKCGKAVATIKEATMGETQEQRDTSADAALLIQELEKEAERNKDKWFDIDKDRAFLIRRADKWAKSQTLQFNERYWSRILAIASPDDAESQKLWFEYVRQDVYMLFIKEWRMILTVTPYKHEALFIEEVITEYIREAKANFTFSLIEPDFTTIRAIADKEKEILSDPEPLRVDIAGTPIRYTSWEAVLVVYIENIYIGESIILETNESFVMDEIYQLDLRQKEVIAINEETESVCAAIFARIPMVTNYLRYLKLLKKSLDFTIRFSPSSKIADTEAVALFKTVTLTRGEVTYVDWRGK